MSSPSKGSSSGLMAKSVGIKEKLDKSLMKVNLDKLNEVPNIWTTREDRLESSPNKIKIKRISFNKHSTIFKILAENMPMSCIFRPDYLLLLGATSPFPGKLVEIS